MTVGPKWKQARDQWVARTKPPAGAKVEKPLAAFESKFVKALDAAVKNFDAALVKRDLAAANKVDAAFSKLLLDTDVARKKLKPELEKLKVAGPRVAAISGESEILGDRLREIKSLMASDREALKDSGPRRATDVVPESLFTQLRATPVTRKPDYVKFAGDKKFSVRLATGQADQFVAQAQKNAQENYKKFLAVLKRIDDVQKMQGTPDQVGQAVGTLLEEYRFAVDELSAPVAEWLEFQQMHLKDGVANSTEWKEVKALNTTVLFDEQQRVEKLLLSAKKLLPRYIKV